MPFKDPIKRKEYSKKWGEKDYKENKIKYIERAKTRTKKIRKWYNELRQTKYSKCMKKGGCKFNSNDWRVIDFNHNDPNTKIMNVSDMVSRIGNKQMILDEIEKCTPLCKNCHAIHTHENEHQKLRKS